MLRHTALRDLPLLLKLRKICDSRGGFNTRACSPVKEARGCSDLDFDSDFFISRFSVISSYGIHIARQALRIERSASGQRLGLPTKRSPRSQIVLTLSSGMLPLSLLKTSHGSPVVRIQCMADLALS